MTAIRVEPLTAEAFAPFGRVLGQPSAAAPDAARDDLEAWVNFSDLMGLERAEPMWTFLRVRHHTQPVTRLERHVHAAKAIIPLEGTCVLVAALGGGPDDPGALPDENTLRAFLLDGSAGVLLPRGCWHWVSFAVTETATFMLLMEKAIFGDIEEQPIGERHLALY
jgi:ureidoglycolate lyase